MEKGTSSILVVDDNPQNLKLSRFLLEGAGFSVVTAPDAEEALVMVEQIAPLLILVDIQLPGMDGLELTRRLRQVDHLKEVGIVALTAYAMQGDEQRAISAGCDGYITKPIDTRTFTNTVRGYLTPPAGKTESARRSAHVGEFEKLREEFFESSQSTIVELLADPAQLDNARARTSLHQIAGAGGTFGAPEVSAIAREAESLLNGAAISGQDRFPVLLAELRNALESARFPQERTEPISPDLKEKLDGVRFALIDIPQDWEDRITAALEDCGAFCRAFTSQEPASKFKPFDGIICSTPNSNPAMQKIVDELAKMGKSLLLLSQRNQLAPLSTNIPVEQCDFLLEPWVDAELILRASLLAGRSAREKKQSTAKTAGPPKVMIADDDPTISALLQLTLKNYGLETVPARDGKEALDLARVVHPSVAVLDVNMPHLDGFEVLASLKSDITTASIPVLILTGLQQETDVLRGFSLGADDYMTKPFSPMELVARLKRLLRSSS